MGNFYVRDQRQCSSDVSNPNGLHKNQATTVKSHRDYWNVLFDPVKIQILSNEFGPKNRSTDHVCRTQWKAGMFCYIVGRCLIVLDMQVYERLQKLFVTVSHKSTIRLVKALGKDFDKPVKDWRDSILPSLNTCTEPVS